MRRFRRRDILATTTALVFGFKTGAIHGQETPMHTDLILVNGRFTTLDRANPNPEAVAIAGGRFSAVGNAHDILATQGPATKIIDLGGRSQFDIGNAMFVLVKT